MHKYLKQHLFSVGCACLLLLTNSFLQVFAATRMADLANALIAKNINLFGQLLMLIFLLWFISFIISFFESYIEESATQDILTDIRNDIATALTEMPENDFQNNPVDYYESYLQNDVNLIQREGVNTFFRIVRFSGNAIFALIALYLYSPILFITAIFLVVLIVLVPRLCKKYLSNGVEEISKANEKFLKYTSSGLHGYETLFVFNALSEIKKLVDTGSSILKKANVHNAIRRSIVDIITSVVNIGSQLIILGITGFLHFKGVLSAGAILSTAELATKVFDSAGIINRYLAQLLSTSGIFAKFSKLKNLVIPDKQKFDLASFPMQFKTLEFRDVSFSYPGSRTTILSHFSYAFTRDNFYKLNGDSGRGKSTLLKLATGQLKPNSGEILLNGININQIPQEVINELIIYLPQKVTIFPYSINYNISLGRKVNLEKLASVKEKFGIDDSWQYNSLSGGQKQRVALARLIDSTNKLVLLDESFSSIDLKSSQDLLQMFLKDCKTIVLVSHRNNEIGDFPVKNLTLK